MTTSLFAAAAARKIFNPGDTLSASADGTNGTPDLRGYFIRGRGNVGTGAAGNDPSGGRAAAPITDGTNGIPRTSTETRPKNVALTDINCYGQEMVA